MNALKTRARMRGQGGFTLIELLIVIAILGILAGVVVYAIGGTTDSAREKACMTERQTIETALEAYKADAEIYPTTLGSLKPKYLKSEPKTANWSFTANTGTVQADDGGGYAAVVTKCNTN